MTLYWALRHQLRIVIVTATLILLLILQGVPNPPLPEMTMIMPNPPCLHYDDKGHGYPCLPHQAPVTGESAKH